MQITFVMTEFSTKFEKFLMMLKKIKIPGSVAIVKLTYLTACIASSGALLGFLKIR